MFPLLTISGKSPPTPSTHQKRIEENNANVLVSFKNMRLTLVHQSPVFFSKIKLDQLRLHHLFLVLALCLVLYCVLRNF